MAGVTGSSSRGQRRAADASTESVDQGEATGAPISDTAEGGDSTAPAAADGDASSGSPPPMPEGQPTGEEGQGGTDAAAPVSGVASALAEQLEALTARNAELQARIDVLEAGQSHAAVPGQPSLDALLAEQAGRKVWAIEVVGPAAGRWRAGRRFGPEAQCFVEGELTDGELKAIQADPLLTVGVSQIPVHAAETL